MTYFIFAFTGTEDQRFNTDNNQCCKKRCSLFFFLRSDGLPANFNIEAKKKKTVIFKTSLLQEFWSSWFIMDETAGPKFSVLGAEY